MAFVRITFSGLCAWIPKKPTSGAPIEGTVLLVNADRVLTTPKGQKLDVHHPLLRYGGKEYPLRNQDVSFQFTTPNPAVVNEIVPGGYGSQAPAPNTNQDRSAFWIASMPEVSPQYGVLDPTCLTDPHHPSVAARVKLTAGFLGSLGVHRDHFYRPIVAKFVEENPTGGVLQRSFAPGFATTLTIPGNQCTISLFDRVQLTTQTIVAKELAGEIVIEIENLCRCPPLPPDGIDEDFAWLYELVKPKPRLELRRVPTGAGIGLNNSLCPPARFPPDPAALVSALRSIVSAQSAKALSAPHKVILRNCPYHAQDDADLCGAAVETMILAFLGGSLPSVDQARLHRYNQSAGTLPDVWGAEPAALGLTLTRVSQPTRVCFPLSRSDRQESLRDLVHSIQVRNLPAALLYSGCLHWVTVIGFQSDRDPTQPRCRYTVHGVWLHNPVFPCLPAGFVHGPQDPCGSGSAWGVTREWVSYAGWQWYVNPCPLLDGGFVTVTDSEPDGDLTVPLPGDTVPIWVGQAPMPRGELAEIVKEHLARYDLLSEIPTQGALLVGESGLVRVLDADERWYYLTALRDEEGLRAVARVNATDGLVESIGIQGASSSSLFPTDERLEDLVRGAGERLSIPEAAMPAVLDEVRAKPLVWRMCQQSYSPYLPFFEVCWEYRMLYIRIDGEVFPELTAGLYGG